jgi:MoaA/NifB/PqqE/SkfB family radical SAM enzyme
MKKMPNAAGPRVHIAYMLLASNWREVESLPTLAQNWGASQVVVNNLSFVCSSDLEKESLFRRPDLWDAARAALEDAKQRAIGLGIEFYYYRPDEQEPRPVCTENVLHSCFVSHSGDVSPCVLTNLSMRGTDAGCHLFRGHAYPLEHLVFGSVRNQSLREVWHSASAQAFRSAFEQRMKHHRELSDVPEPCRHCYKLFEGAT